MPFYRAKAETFLQDAKDFVMQKYAKNLHQTVVIVPNVYAANQILQAFVNNVKTPSLIPKVIPIEEIGIIQNAIVALDKGEFASYFEQQLLIANILFRSCHYNFNARQSIDLSKSVLVLLHEFIKSECEPSEIANLSCDHFLQLQTLSQFLQTVKDEWLLALSRNHIKDVVQTCIAGCKTLSQLITQNLYQGNLVLIGIAEPFAFDLCKSALQGHFDVILPFDSKLSLKVVGLIEYCKVKSEDVVLIEEVKNVAPILKDFEDSISYKTFPNEIKELNFVVDLILSHSEQYPGQKIAVVLEDLELNHTLIQTLRGYGIEVKNSLGLSLSRNIFIQFLILIANFWQQDRGVKDFIALLKHPYLDSDLCQEFECFAIEKCLILQSFDYALVLIQNQFQEVYQIAQKLVFPLQDEDLFCSLLEQHLHIAQNLCPSLWQQSQYRDVSDYIRDLVKSAKHFQKVDSLDYPHIFSKLVQGKFYEDFSLNARVEIISPQNIEFLNADLLVVPNFHDESWPNLGDSDIWLSDNIRSMLGLSDIRAMQLERYRDYFVRALSFPCTFFTRACKIGGKETIESRFWSQRVHTKI